MGSGSRPAGACEVIRLSRDEGATTTKNVALLTVRAWFDWLTMSGLRYRGTTIDSGLRYRGATIESGLRYRGATIESGLRYRGTTIQRRWGAFDLIDNAGGGGYNEPLASLPK